MANTYCACGCGNVIKPGNRYKWGHNMRGVPSWNRAFNKAQCLDDKCGRKAECRGMCRKHYQVWYRAEQRAKKLQRSLLQTNK